MTIKRNITSRAEREANAFDSALGLFCWIVLIFILISYFAICDNSFVATWLWK